MLLFLVYIETAGNCTSGHSLLLNKPPMYVEILKRPLHVLLSYLSACGLQFAVSPFQKFFLPTARQVKRIESVLRSPIYNHFSETISGVQVIRAYRCPKRFMDEMDRRVDTNVKFFFAANTSSR